MFFRTSLHTIDQRVAWKQGVPSTIVILAALLSLAGSATTHLCQRAGLHAYKIGEEAIVDLSTFTLQGKKGSPVRHAIARAKRVQLSIHCWQGGALLLATHSDAVAARANRILHLHDGRLSDV